MIFSGHLVNTITWKQVESTKENSINIIDDGDITLDKIFSTGSGTFEANQVWFENSTLAFGAVKTFDLQALTSNILGSTSTTVFTNIKEISVRLLSSSGNIHITTSGVSNPFPGFGDSIELKGSGVVSKLIPLGTPTASGYEFKLQNVSDTTPYHISVIGN